MQALVGTDEVESVDPTMLIPVSILWWHKCCHLLLCHRQVPPWLSVWLHKLKLYLHSLVINLYCCTFRIVHYCMFCGGFLLTFFGVTVVLLCVMTCVFLQVINQKVFWTLQYFCHWECCCAAVVGTGGNLCWYPKGGLYFACVWFLFWLVNFQTCVPFLICIWSSRILMHCFYESTGSFVLCIYGCMCYIPVTVLCCCGIGSVGCCE